MLKEQVIKPIYDRFIRPQLPRKITMMNGVPARRARLFDEQDIFPDYEAPLLESLRESVQTGDQVVIVGAGWGVSAVVSSEEAESVIAYEAGDEHFKHAKETIEINQAENVDLRRALVGPAIDVYGKSTTNQVNPAELPEADILELDCEGAEQDILELLPEDYQPRVILVEVHPHLGVEEDNIYTWLNERGYKIVGRGIENKKHNVTVLTALQDEHN